MYTLCATRLLTDTNKCFQKVSQKASQGLWKISKSPLQGSRIWMQSFLTQKEPFFYPVSHQSQDANDFHVRLVYVLWAQRDRVSSAATTKAEMTLFWSD